MSLKNETELFSRVEVSIDSGEIEAFDRVIFPNVIRKRQVNLILNLVKEINPERILDFGCGAGWLSKVLSSNGYKVVGIDATPYLIKKAAMLPLAGSHFAVGDCMNLPFRDKTFDLIIGVAILHHLDVGKALAECRRVTGDGAVTLFLEPNKLNPISALGGKISPHTERESHLTSWGLRRSLIKQGWTVKKVQCLFPYSFGLAYLLGKTRFKDSSKLGVIGTLIEISEKLLEKVPLLNQFGSTLIVVAEKGKLP